MSSAPWSESMPEDQFGRMREILAAPSPIGIEAAMTYGVLKPMMESFMPAGWQTRQFGANAGLVFDTHPGRDDLFTLMIMGHADKIRMQVRSIGSDGKIWIDSESFLPQVLVGHEVTLYSENPDAPGAYRSIRGGTVEALGAIHFAPPKYRTGESGVKKEMLYLELHTHGEKRKEQIEALGVRAGDTILLDRPIKRGYSPDTFYGAYLDNGLGCFVAEEVARLVAGKGFDNVRVQFTMTTHEEIGRYGARVHAHECKPDALIAVDVNHDYEAANIIADKKMPPLAMGKGYSYAVGAIVSEQLNRLMDEAAIKANVPRQRDVCGRDTGTDAMGAAFANIDCAAASVGFPIRNMHTISEAAHTGDVLAAIHMLAGLIEHMNGLNDGKGIAKDAFHHGHPRLDQSSPLGHQGTPESASV